MGCVWVLYPERNIWSDKNPTAIVSTIKVAMTGGCGPKNKIKIAGRNPKKLINAPVVIHIIRINLDCLSSGY